VIFIEILRFHGPANAMTKMSYARSIAAALVAALVAVGAFWFVPVRGPAGVDPTDPALVALGKNVYADRCASCHGEHLEVQPNWRRRLPNGRLPAPPHDAAGHTWHHPDRELFEITQERARGHCPGIRERHARVQGRVDRP
jgi:hypothetical protein